MLLLRVADEGTFHAVGWLSLKGIRPYAAKELSSQQLQTLNEYDSAWVRLRDGGVDRLLLPVEMECTDGGLFQTPLAYSVDSLAWSRTVQTGQRLPADLSLALSTSLDVSSGSRLPRGARSDMRAWRLLRIASPSSSMLRAMEPQYAAQGVGCRKSYGIAVSRAHAQQLGFSVPAYQMHDMLSTSVEAVEVDDDDATESEDEDNGGAGHFKYEFESARMFLELAAMLKSGDFSCLKFRVLDTSDVLIRCKNGFRFRGE